MSKDAGQVDLVAEREAQRQRNVEMRRFAVDNLRRLAECGDPAVQLEATQQLLMMAYEGTIP